MWTVNGGIILALYESIEVLCGLKFREKLFKSRNKLEVQLCL